MLVNYSTAVQDRVRTGLMRAREESVLGGAERLHASKFTGLVC